MLRMNTAVHTSIQRQLRRWVDNPADVDELTQDVLLKLHMAGPDEDEAVGRWVRRVARNAAIDHLRTRRASTELPELATEATADDDGTVEVASWLPAMLDGVPEPYRTAVRRVDLDGISQQELAAELGISASGARSRVQRGRKMLRETLLACCPVKFEGGEVVDTGLNDCSRC
jgi:RNA polymerase sigma-70 factor (ECF subfamily)